MQRLLASVLIFALILSPSTPLLAGPEDFEDPLQDSGDFVSLEQMQEGQQQSQQQQQHAAAVENQLTVQAASTTDGTGLSFSQVPTYTASIPRTGNFSAQFQLENTSGRSRTGYVLVASTKAGTTTSKEIYRNITIPTGTSVRDITITRSQLAAKGITPGQYQVTFMAFNELDQKIGDGFFGNPLSIGSAVPTIASAPAYSSQINPGQNLVSTWSFTNTGDSTATVTLLTVVTPSGATDPAQSKEFYKTNVSIAAGGATVQQTVTAAQLAGAGVGSAGRYRVAFVAFDAAGNRLGEFFALPLTIGSSDVHLAAPVIPSQIGVGEGLTVDLQTTQGGSFSEPIYALVAFTPVGSTDPADTIEIYVTGLNANPGQTSHRIFRPAQMLRDAGIDPGRWLVTVTAFNALDQRLEIYYGHLLTIGDIQVTLPTQPVLPSSIGVSGDYGAQFTFVNAGDTADRPVTALLVFTPVGATDPAQSKEFYIKNLTVPPGSSTQTVTVTAAELAAAGITPGNWLVTATGFDGAGTRLQNYFGNFLTIGTVTPAFGSVPTYRRQIPVGGDFLATFSLGNTGDAPGRLTLVTSITPAGLMDPEPEDSREFSLVVTVPPGGGLFDFEISGPALSAAGLTAGDHGVSFVVLDAAGDRVGEFFGNLLRIGEASLAVSSAPVYSDRIGSAEDFTAQWMFDNTGAVSADVDLLTVFTKVGTGTSIEVYRNGLVPANGGGTVNILLSEADRAGAGITDGDYTLTFKAFDANGNIIAEFFGNPLSIGEAALTLPAVPSYTDAIGLDGDLGTTWPLGNSGSSSGEATLVASVTPLGGTDADTVEFRKVVSIPTGGESISFVVTNAELDAAGITGGRYLVSFVAFDPSGTRLGEFFGNNLTIGTISPAFTAVPVYTEQIATGADFRATYTVGNTGDAPDRATLIVSITPVGATDPTATKEFSKIVVLPAGGAAYDFDITGAELQAQGLTGGDYGISFTALDGLGNVIGQFFGNTLRIGEADLSVPASPAYSDSIASSEEFTLQWTFGNAGNISADVQVLTVFTKVGGSTSIEIYRDGLVPAGGGTVNVLLTASDRAGAGITDGDYTLTFKAFDANGNIIAEFFGKPLSIGEASPTFTAQPTYTDSIAQGADFQSLWALGNPATSTGTVTLALSFTRAGTAQTTEFDLNVEVSPGGGNFQFNVTSAELAAQGIGAGSYTVSFVAIDAANNRLGEFFGLSLTIGTPAPALTGGAPSFSNQMSAGSSLTTRWSFSNSGDAPADLTLVVAVVPLADLVTSAVTEFSLPVTVPVGGGTFQFEITPQQLAAAGIDTGRFQLSFVVLDASGNRIAESFGNLITIGTIEPTFSSVPAYTDSLPLGGDFRGTYTLGNTGDAPDQVTLVTVITPAGSTDPAASKEFSTVVTLLPGGGTFNFDIAAADLAAAGIGGGQYRVAFVALDGLGIRIGTGFFGNGLQIGESQPTFTAVPDYTGQLLEGRNFESDWTLGNGGQVSSALTLVVAITAAGQTREFNFNVTVPAGGANFHLEVTAADLQAAGIVPGSYTVSFVAVDSQGTHVGEFFGNALELLPAGTPLAFLLGQQLTSGPRSGLLETWEVPQNDPLYPDLADRAFTYDQAIAAVALMFAGQEDAALKILDVLALLEGGTGRLGFLYGVGPQAEDFSAVYTGTNAWVGDALATYEGLTEDTRYRAFAERIAETLLSFRDPTTGLLRGGEDADGNAFPWISTEHNLDAYSFFDDLAIVTKDPRWRLEADNLAAAIDTHLWTGTHFLGGFGDDQVSLDAQALGGLYLAFLGDAGRADTLRTFIEENLKVTVDVNGAPVTGYAPYRNDTFIWVEGSLLVALFDTFIGRFTSARAIQSAMEAFRAASGGLGYSSSTQSTAAAGVDALFPAFPSVISTAWERILDIYLAIFEPTITVSAGGDFSASIAVTNAASSPEPVTLVGSFAPVSGGDPISVTQSSTAQPGRSFLDFHLMASELSLLNILPGLYSFTLLAFNGFGSLVSDGFFSALVDFLFG